MKSIPWVASMIGSTVGWALGNLEGIGTAIVVSGILTVVSYYYGWKLMRHMQGY